MEKLYRKNVANKKRPSKKIPVNKASFKTKNSMNTNYYRIITSEKTLFDNLKEFDLEEEKVRLAKGMCFGEWGILYNIQRSASAFTMEDTHLVSIEKEFFKNCFHKNILRAVAEKKVFFVKKLPFLRGSNKVEEFLKNINPLVINRLIKNIC